MRLRFARLSLLTKIMLSTSVAVTVLFAITGQIVLRNITQDHVGQPGRGGAGQLSGLHFTVERANRAADRRVSRLHGQHVGRAGGVRHTRPGHHPGYRERVVVADFDLRRDSSW